MASARLVGVIAAITLALVFVAVLITALGPDKVVAAHQWRDCRRPARQSGGLRRSGRAEGARGDAALAGRYNHSTAHDVSAGATHVRPSGPTGASAAGVVEGQGGQPGHPGPTGLSRRAFQPAGAGARRADAAPGPHLA